MVAAALLDGEAEELVRTAVELAKTGDRMMLKFLLDKLLPREWLGRVDLPRIESVDDAVAALAEIARAASAGEIPSSQAAALATVVNHHVRAIDTAELVKRIDQIEAALKELSE